MTIHEVEMDILWNCTVKGGSLWERGNDFLKLFHGVLIFSPEEVGISSRVTVRVLFLRALGHGQIRKIPLQNAK